MSDESIREDIQRDMRYLRESTQNELESQIYGLVDQLKKVKMIREINVEDLINEATAVAARARRKRLARAGRSKR